jgi:hypothetical protein
MSKAQGIANSANQGQFKNRIINGAIMIDQRRAGASFTPTQSDGSAVYLVDRFAYTATQASKVSWQQSTIAPTGFKNSLVGTVVSATTVGTSDQFTLCQFVEGFNASDLGFGTASASTITLSFWVRSSVTGTYTVAVGNNAYNRQYLANYTINAVNTWEQKSVTIAGDTTGTWTTDNTSGLRVNWDLGSGSSTDGTANAWQNNFPIGTSGSVNWIATNGATFYITGVQLEKGSTATSFDYRPYGTELALCQRYFCLIDSASGTASSTTACNLAVSFPVQMRSAPTATMATARITDASTADYQSTAPSITLQNSSINGARPALIGFTGLTTNRPAILLSSGTNAAPINFSAEL